MRNKENEAYFVQSTLPWIVAAGALILYLVTLNHWVTLASLPVVAKVTDWDWWNLTLQAPLFFALTSPVRLLPREWQPVVLNLFSAVCAAGGLGLLAGSVALLPHDRTRDQRQRERSDFSLLTIRAAWVPPVLAALALGLQRTFWEHATAATGEALNVLLFAYIIYCLLQFRLEQRESWLTRLSFVYGLAVTNNWAMIGFFPAFLIATIWIKGWSFFRGRFMLRMIGFGVLGLLLYLLLPFVESLGDKTHMNFWELLRFEWGAQKAVLMVFPKYVVLVCGLTSLLPVLVMGFRWPSSFGDTSVLGAMLTNLMFRVVHAILLVACAWVMFDPPFSPRVQGYGIPFLTFYYLSALSIGYFSGYFLLVFGTEPEKRHHRVSLLARQFNRFLAGLVWVALVAVPAGLVYLNWPAIRADNGPYLKTLANSLAQELPAKGGLVLSDEPNDLLLVEAVLDRAGTLPSYLMLDTASLPYMDYYHNLRRRFPQKWPDFLGGHDLSDPIASVVLLRWMISLAQSNEVYYLHPSFGYYFEGLYAQPKGLVYSVKPYESNAIVPPPIGPGDLAANMAFWAKAKADLATLPRPKVSSSREENMTDAEFVAQFYSRAANYWGVLLQQNNHLAEAGSSFDQAIELNPNNVVAKINREYNRNLRHGNTRAVELSTAMQDQIHKYRFWEDMWRDNGPFDEVKFCMQEGETLGLMRPPLIRQAAQQFLRVCSLDATNVETGIWLANMYLQWPMPEKALDLVQSIRDQAKTHPVNVANQLELYRLQAWAYASQTNLIATEKVLQEAEQRFPGESSLPETASQIYLRNGLFTNALAALEEQLRMDPGNVKALLNKGALCIQIKDFKRAIPPLDQVLRIEPRNSAAQMNRAIANLQDGNLVAAEKDYEALLEMVPHFYRAYFGLAQIAYQRHNTSRAIDNYELYLKYAPRDTRKVLRDQAEAQYVANRLKELRSGASSP
ncbi:MAG: tetratricopeptide repeat protein [Candidatus Omnitrophica bacterium]|nr:tetratricopeptide repeat protein [Candidatus Omnitrophota bacterium]